MIFEYIILKGMKPSQWCDKAEVKLFLMKEVVFNVTWIKSVSRMSVPVRNLNRSQRKYNMLKNKAYMGVEIKQIDGRCYVEFDLPTYTLVRDPK
jgi:hypothetical protein